MFSKTVSFGYLSRNRFQTEANCSSDDNLDAPEKIRSELKKGKVFSLKFLKKTAEKWPDDPINRELIDHMLIKQSLSGDICFFWHIINLKHFDIIEKLIPFLASNFKLNPIIKALISEGASKDLIKKCIDGGLKFYQWGEIRHMQHVDENMYYFLLEIGVPFFNEHLVDFVKYGPENVARYVIENMPEMRTAAVLDAAIYKEKWELVDFMLQYDFVMSKTTLYFSLAKNDRELIMKLLDRGAIPCNSAFGKLAEKNDVELLDLMITKSGVCPGTLSYHWLKNVENLEERRRGFEQLMTRGAGALDGASLSYYLPCLPYEECMHLLSTARDIEGFEIDTFIDDTQIPDRLLPSIIDVLRSKGISETRDTYYYLQKRNYAITYSCVISLSNSRIYFSGIDNSLFLNEGIIELARNGVFLVLDLNQLIDKLQNDRSHLIKPVITAVYENVTDQLNPIYNKLLTKEMFEEYIDYWNDHSYSQEEKRDKVNEYCINHIKLALSAYYLRNIEWRKALNYTESIQSISNWKELYPTFTDVWSLGNLYGTFGFNPDVYHQLYEHIKNSYEGCSEKEKKIQAYKLTVLFETTERALQYLDNFKKHNEKKMKRGERFTTQPIHDACLFELPKSGVWNISKWRKYMEDNGSNPLRFKMLSFAPLIEFHCWRGVSHRPEADRTPSNYRKLLINLFKDDQEFGKQILSVLTEMRSKRNRQNTRRLNDLLLLGLKKYFPTSMELIKERQGSKVLQRFDTLFPLFCKMQDPFTLTYKEIALIATCELFGSIPIEYHQFALQAVKFGINKEALLKAIKILKEKEHFELIPEITMTTKKGDAFPSNWRFEKINTKNPEIFYLGKQTGCCQNIGDHSSAVVVHGATSSYGGFYRIMDTSEGKVKYIAQSYVGIAIAPDHEKFGGFFELVIDSIETPYKNLGPQVLSMYRKAAEQILSDNPMFIRVVFGAGGQTPEDHSFPLQDKPQDGYSPILGYKEGGYDSLEKRYILAEVNTAQAVQPNIDMDAVVIKGTDTYVNKGKQQKDLVLHPHLRALFFKRHPQVLKQLQSDTHNPLIREGKDWGEHFITADMLQQLLRRWFTQSRINIAWTCINNNLTQLEQWISNTDFSSNRLLIGYVDGVHATCAYIQERSDGQQFCFIYDSEGTSGVPDYFEKALSKRFPKLSYIYFDQKLQIDFYSCSTLTYKAMTYFAKHGETFFDLIEPKLTQLKKNIYRIDLCHLPGYFLKFAQMNITFTDGDRSVFQNGALALESKRKTEIVSSKRLTFEDHVKANKVSGQGKQFNASALRLKYRLYEKLDVIEE